MSKKLAFLVVILFALVSALPVAAQGGGDSVSFPVCTRTQLNDFRDTISDFILTDYNAVNERLNNLTQRTIPVFIEEMDALRTQWYEDIVPDLPQCAEAFRFRQLFGPALDELLIVGLYGLGGDGYLSDVRSHGERASTMRDAAFFYFRMTDPEAN